MWNEEELPAKTATKPRNLDPLSPEGALDRMSVEELKEYIVMLEAEIQRVEAEITKKGASKAAAEAFFK